MNETIGLPPVIFEYLMKLLEVSVVLGIGVIIYITKTQSKKINKSIDEEFERKGYGDDY